MSMKGWTEGDIAAYRKRMIGICAETLDKTTAGLPPRGFGKTSMITPAKKPRKPKRKGPNETESRFNRDMIGVNCCGLFEQITFILPGGSKYTPDWAVFMGCVTLKIIGVDWNHFTVEDCARVMKENPYLVIRAYEVKGAYRFGSEGRALTAFRECRAQFPAVRFSWWQWDGKGWTEKHAED